MYNAKVDVFACAVMLYQIFAGTNITSRFSAEADGYAFARRVADGHRPSIPAKLPAALAALLRAGWAEEPAERPTVAQMLTQLRAVAASPELSLIHISEPTRPY